MTWGKIIVAGTEQDLTHLDPFVMQTQASGRPQRNVLVTFGCHCFARDTLPGDPVEHLIRDGRRNRCFCPIRTVQSQGLEVILRAAGGGPAFFTQQGQNMALVMRVPGLVGPYAIFFNVRSSTAKNMDVHLFVASAYEKPNLVRAMPAIAFNTLIDEVSEGRTPRRPPRKTRW